MKRTIRIVSLLITLIGFQMQVNGQTLPVACVGSRVRYGVSGSPNSVFNWEVQGGSISNNYNDSIDILWDNTEGLKVIKVTEYTVSNCIGAPTYGYVVVAIPNLSINKQNICAGQTATIEAIGDFTKYLWSTGETTKTITASTEGLYKLQATDANGCTATDSAYLTVNQLPHVYLGRDTAICEGQSITLDAGTDGNIYRWSTGDNSQTIQVGVGSQTIWVAVENSNGCIGSDTINMLPCRHLNVTIPNAFTPNGDPDNPTWKIKGLENISNVSIEIFDRWGRRVFQSKHGLPEGGWDGTYNGRNLPMDSYYYIIDFHDGATPTTGTVTIIR